MKTRYFLLILLLFCIHNLDIYAQDDSTIITKHQKIYTSKNQLKIGYAYNSFNRIFSALFIENNTIETPKEYGFYRRIRNEKRLLVSSINLSYQKQVKKKLNIGVVFTTDIYKRSYEQPYKDSLFSVKEFTQVYTIMPSIYFHYLNHKIVDLYLGGDVGLMFMSSKAEELNYNYGNEKHFNIIPTANFCPFGIQLKYVVSPYLQVNVGSRGWVEGGILFNIK